MSKQFIEQRIGSLQLQEAERQQDQILYNTQGSVQQRVTAAYLDAFAKKNYSTSDYFLNYVKSILKTPNFLSFYRHFRNPVPSTKVINKKIKNQLNRVFHSEDAFFHVEANDKEQEVDKILLEKIFNKYLFKFNDIVVVDVFDGKGKEVFIEIKNVVAIDSEDSIINKIAYSAQIVIDEEVIQGTAYIDDSFYRFYDEKLRLINEQAHDLGRCPADYISYNPFTSDIVRESIFTHVLPQLEELNFLKTLQRMSDVAGSIPKTVALEVEVEGENSNLEDKQQPMSSSMMGGQQSKYGDAFNAGESVLQPGDELSIPPIKKADGSIDMDVIKNFAQFFYLPVEAMEFINKRLIALEQDIVVSVVGDFSEVSESSKNELQISKGYISKQDVLRDISKSISRVYERVVYNKLSLTFGPNNVHVDVFLGSDFFLETQEEIFKMYNEAPNPIERRNLLIRNSRNKNKFNPIKAKREMILYHLIPYTSDKDFTFSVENNQVDSTTFNYQTRFDYWISTFESQYGDIVSVWDDNDDISEAKKIQFINNLIILQIKDYEQNKNGVVEAT